MSSFPSKGLVQLDAEAVGHPILVVEEARDQRQGENLLVRKPGGPQALDVLPHDLAGIPGEALGVFKDRLRLWVETGSSVVFLDLGDQVSIPDLLTEELSVSLRSIVAGIELGDHHRDRLPLGAAES